MGLGVGCCITIPIILLYIFRTLEHGVRVQERVANAQQKVPARLLVKTFVADVMGEIVEEAFKTLDEELESFCSADTSVRVHSVRDSVFNIHGYGQIARTVVYSK